MKSPVLQQNKKLENFWSKTWENTKVHNEEASWIKEEEQRLKDVKQQEWKSFTTQEIGKTVLKTSNWKSPGHDQLANFWIKNLTALHEDLAKAYNIVIQEPEKTPAWLTVGRTILLPKTKETRAPNNYRPITCLPTMYKLLTSMVAERIYEFLHERDLFPKEQKGCKKGSYGCKDQLLINKIILEEVKSRKKNLSTAWIDYRKAFDSVPHSWIARTLQMYKVNPAVTNFITNNMKSWTTYIQLQHSEGTINTRAINITNGIFQGDSLSPLLFCMALFPLSSLLNETSYGYKCENITINHLVYIDDLKLYAKNDEQLTGLLETVHKFSTDICMSFGLDKCAKASFHRGRLTETLKHHARRKHNNQRT